MTQSAIAIANLRQQQLAEYNQDADFLAGRYTGVQYDDKGRICASNGIAIVYPKTVAHAVRKALRSPEIYPCLLMRQYVTPCQWSAGNPVTLMTRALVPLRRRHDLSHVFSDFIDPTSLGERVAGMKPALAAPYGTLQGRAVVISGHLHGLTLDQAKAMVESAGGHVAGSVTKKVDYFVAGDNPSSEKHQKALELGIPVIDVVALGKLAGWA